MGRMYRWVDHTGEIELEIHAASEGEVFVEALAALGELVGERAERGGGGPVVREVRAAAPDRASLLAEWLGELVYLVEREGLVPQAARRLELRNGQVLATVVGRLASVPHLVKAVTYHRLGMWEEDGAWRARVVFDV